MMNHYQLNKNQYNLLPNNYIYNTQSKINSMNNSAYIDTFFSYIASNITLKKLPSFPLYYGCSNGIIDEFLYDISEELLDFEKEKWFSKFKKKKF